MKTASIKTPSSKAAKASFPHQAVDDAPPNSPPASPASRKRSTVNKAVAAAAETPASALAATPALTQESSPASAPPASREELIRHSAYLRYLARGDAGGSEIEDWLQAEAGHRQHSRGI